MRCGRRMSFSPKSLGEPLNQVSNRISNSIATKFEPSFFPDGSCHTRPRQPNVELPFLTSEVLTRYRMQHEAMS